MTSLECSICGRKDTTGLASKPHVLPLDVLKYHYSKNQQTSERGRTVDPNHKAQRNPLGAELAGRGQIRKNFIDPLLNQKGWSLGDWSDHTDPKVDYKTIANYLKGTTTPRPSTRKQLADAIGIDVENLPR